jgi:UDP-4-amino-4,6-dideoxy-N-acetyl-beta-L-altrosamine transaminase
MNLIPYGRQDITLADINAVTDVLKSDFLTQGPKVSQFEEAVALHVGASYGVAVNSATSALHIACIALGLTPGDHLWTSPITFVASANCGLYCGANVDFVDIDPQTYLMDPDSLEKKLSVALKVGKLPKILVLVHLAGQSCDMQRFNALSVKYGFKIIEDASHAIGGKYLDAYVGCCEYSEITVFSFHPVKIITSAEGGMAMSNCRVLTEKMRSLRSHGITRDPLKMTSESHGDWFYQQQELGFNYRMTDLHAALGLSQLSRLDGYVERRNQLSDVYHDGLSGLPLQLPAVHKDSLSSWHLYVVRLKLGEMRSSRKEVFDALRAAGIGVNVHYIPVHIHPAYMELGFNIGDFFESESYYSEALSLPLFPGISSADQIYVMDTLKKVIDL